MRAYKDICAEGTFEEELTEQDPHKFIKEFHVVCSNMRPHGVTEEQLNLKTFPFALKDDIKHWLYILPAGFVTIWAQMKKLFLEKIFPAFHTTKTRKEIYDIMQALILQYFYKRLVSNDKSMIDAAVREVLVNKAPSNQVKPLISPIVANAQQFGTRDRVLLSTTFSQEVNEIRSELVELTTLVKEVFIAHGWKPQDRVCSKSLEDKVNSLSDTILQLK
ncbi:uncharacterized protein E5676_scaffold204G00840 [Cucumis melo var. makuwa]|uniref:Retrotransposon gag domain-containing protein n=1 Tax=Cucumis melo var. makuwa TaxID=1194695 RepID=A0A5D3D5P5_CUCMM|nr:uncharacterized protein E5676_scaffold204G00840 [Cucumis melo var. makuwa]